jgi:hypothetical protein
MPYGNSSGPGRFLSVGQQGCEWGPREWLSIERTGCSRRERMLSSGAEGRSSCRSIFFLADQFFSSPVNVTGLLGWRLHSRTGHGQTRLGFMIGCRPTRFCVRSSASALESTRTRAALRCLKMIAAQLLSRRPRPAHPARPRAGGAVTDGSRTQDNVSCRTLSVTTCEWINAYFMFDHATHALHRNIRSS